MSGCTETLPTSTCSAPAVLAETGMGFDGHILDLNPTEHRMYSRVMSENLNDSRVIAGLALFERFGDRGTYYHSLRVGAMAAAVAIKIGLAERDVRIAGLGGLTHDLGKADRATQVSINSPVRFSDDPALMVPVRSHPIRSGLMARQYGFSNNVAMIGASHHAYQEHAYGIGPERVRAYPEADGYVPPTALLSQVTAAADHFDARSVAKSVSCRSYADERETNPAIALESIEALAIAAVVKDAVADVAAAAAK